jgi:hypothetical protein
MEPAKSIVASLGGPRAVAIAVGISASGVCKWYGDKGHDGLVPSRYIPALCRLARERGQFLEPNMFFAGRI